MDQGFLIPLHGGNEGDHILKVGFGGDALLEVIGIASFHPAAIAGIVEDSVLLGRSYLPGIGAEGDPAPLSQMAEDGKVIRLGRVAFDRHDAAVGAAQDIVVGVEFDRCGSDHIQKVLGLPLRLGNARFLRRGLFIRFLPLLLHALSPSLLHQSF